MTYPSFDAAQQEVGKRVCLLLIELQADPALRGAAAEVLSRQPAEAQRAARTHLEGASA